jgi:hypothetical protein
VAHGFEKNLGRERFWRLAMHGKLAIPKSKTVDSRIDASHRLIALFGRWREKAAD